MSNDSMDIAAAPGYALLSCLRMAIDQLNTMLPRSLPNRGAIMAINGANDARRNIAGASEAPANIAAIKRKITARRIRIIDAMALDLYWFEAVLFISRTVPALD